VTQAGVPIGYFGENWRIIKDHVMAKARMFSVVPKQILLLPAALLLLSGCMSGPSNVVQEEEPVEVNVLEQFEDMSVDEIIEAGDSAALGGEMERAIFIYMQALSLEENGEIWFKIGWAYAGLGEKKNAWRAYNNAIQLNPENARAFEEIGLLYLSAKRRELAKVNLERAIEIDATRWRSYNALGVLADTEQQYDLAIEYYTAALDNNPESAMLLNNLGYSHYLAGDLDEAEIHFRIAVSADGNYLPAMANLGLIYARQRKYDKAIATLSKIMEKPQAYNDVGYIAFHNGDLKKASWLLAEAIHHSPTYYEIAYQNLAKVKKATKEQETEALEAPMEGGREEFKLRENHQTEHRRVNAEWLNIRKSSDTDGEIVGSLKTGTRVEVLFDNGEWSFISYGESATESSATGWVRSRYLSASLIADSG
jgi:tetratricopeptide (TPR) repeat protein